MTVTGVALTVRLAALLTVTLPVSVVDTVVTVFEGFPVVESVTLTLITHDELFKTPTPLIVIVPLPLVGLKVPGLLHVFDFSTGLATVIPEGKLSVKVRLVNGAGFALLPIVKVRTDVPPAPIVEGVKAIANVGGLNT